MICCYSASTKTSFGFCSCSEILQLKFGEKKVAGKCKLFSLQIYFVTTGNPRYLGGKQNISFSQNLPNMGRESCTVLRPGLMRKLAMSLIGLTKVNLWVTKCVTVKTLFSTKHRMFRAKIYPSK